MKQRGTVESQDLGLWPFMITSFNTTLSTFHDLFEQNAKTTTSLESWLPNLLLFCIMYWTRPGSAFKGEADCFYISLKEAIYHFTYFMLPKSVCILLKINIHYYFYHFTVHSVDYLITHTNTCIYIYILFKKSKIYFKTFKMFLHVLIKRSSSGSIYCSLLKL